jgi:very-short-patch-repair endonuclease
MAACMWAGEGSAASHGAAAFMWGIDGYRRGPIEISTIGGKRRRDPEILVHHVDDHLLPDIVEVRGIPATSARRTLLDVAGRRDPRTERALDHALLHDLTSVGQLWLMYEEAWTRGRRGVEILRQLLVQRTSDTAPTHSQLEIMFLRIVRDRHLLQPRTQYPVELDVGPVHLDFAYPEPLIAIEVDGYAWHMDRRSFERDRERDNLLQQQGWIVLRFTWAMLRWQPDRVAEVIREALDHRLQTNQR